MDDYKEIVNEQVYKMCANFLECDIPFTILLDNHNNWDEKLPTRLVDKKQFLLNIKEQTLEDSYVKDGKIVIITTIGDVEYIKELDYNDVSAVSKDDKTPPFINKQFITYPEIKLKEKSDFKLDDTEILKSTLNFKRFNPHLFKED